MEKQTVALPREPANTEQICYTLGLSRGGKYIVVGAETGNRYEFTYSALCIAVDRRDSYGLLQKTKKVNRYKGRRREEVELPIFSRGGN